MSLYRRLRYHLRRLRAISGSPHSMALGCAVGVFMGIMPVLPFRSVMILLVAIPSRSNVLAAFLVGNIVGNPFVLLVWYAAALTCGNLLVVDTVTWERVTGMLDSIRKVGIADSLSLIGSVGWDMVFVLLAGGFLIALPLGAASYFLALRYFVKRQEAVVATPE